MEIHNVKTKLQKHPVTTMTITLPLETPKQEKLESKIDYKQDWMIYQTDDQLETYQSYRPS